MGRGSESTLRIDEPLHFLFLIAYFITYFCCAYLMFICFKHCRRMWRRKPAAACRCRSARFRNVTELVDGWRTNGEGSDGQATAVIPRQVQVTLQPSGICSELFHGTVDPGQDTLSIETQERTNSSVFSPFLSPISRFRLEFELLPSYHDYQSNSEQDSSPPESPPPSYSSCVLQSLLPDNKQSTN